MEAVIGPRGLGNLLHDALRLYILLSPCVDGHVGALKQKQHLKCKLCKLRRGQAKPVHTVKVTAAHKTHVRTHPVSPVMGAIQLLLQFNTQILKRLPSSQ